MKPTVIAYYSRTGVTRKVAEQLAALLDADLEEIREAKDRSGVLGWLSAAWDSTLKREADLTSEHNVAGRKTVVIGMPIWGLKPPPAVRSYLKKVDLAGKKVCAYCVCLATGGGRTLDAVAQRVPGGLAARLPLKKPAADPNLAAILKEWAKQVAG
jgi:flavodoxin